jgi:apolipoprotein D and lipocalin family protein
MKSTDPAMKALALLFMAVSVLATSACSTSRPLDTVPYVDLDRFMGDWYVIANIPTFIERDAHNAIESYEKIDSSTVATTFRFNEGSFDGPLKIYTPTGFIKDTQSNAVWGMQFIWPVKADYRVVYLNDNYTQTVIGRNKRDYLWIMARTPFLPDDDYDRILELIEAQGYDISRIRPVPQQRTDTEDRHGDPDQ